MSLPLKPLTIDSSSKQLDSKQKKFHGSVVRALEHFDSVTEWADYIASLGKLLKALQSWSPQFQNVKYFVPSPYQVSRRLASSLSPNLPAGVHQKTLEVYTFIFEKIGRETLAAECNIWIPGILPLMSYASMSVKSHLIDLYDNYLVQLPSSTLKLLVRPLLASLLPGIDDESSEFLPLTMRLLETLQENLAENSLFWQTCFLVMITSQERRLGGLVWLTKKFPSMNSVPHLVSQKSRKTGSEQEDETSQDAKALRNNALSLLLPEAKDLLSPDPGLLIRCFACCLDDENDLLIKRGIWDLMIQRLHLDSPVLSTLVTQADKQLLLMSCCKTTLAKDMSLNRRLWNWLVGPAAAALANNTNSIELEVKKTEQRGKNSCEYFLENGLQPLTQGLKEMLEEEQSVINVFSICLAVMDRWEVGSLVIPEMFIPLLTTAQKYQMNERILKIANSFFDAVETNIIWGRIFQYIRESGDLGFLQFVLNTFNITSDEEIIIRHLPLILLTILCVEYYDDQPGYMQRLLLCQQLSNRIPERAFLPLETSKSSFDEQDSENIINQIAEFYSRASDPMVCQETERANEIVPPFHTHRLTLLIFDHSYKLLLRNLQKQDNVDEAASVYVTIFNKIPGGERNINPIEQIEEADKQMVDLIFTICRKDAHHNSIFGIAKAFSSYLCLKIPLEKSCRLLHSIITSLWDFLVEPKTQLKALKSLELLETSSCNSYLEGALSQAFMEEPDISRSLTVLELLWSNLDPSSKIISRPLELMIDELFTEENPNYLSVSKWVLSVVNSGTSNRLFYMLTDKLLQAGFLSRDVLEELDDLDMFTYRLRSLTSVLRTNNGIVIRNFATELTSISSLAIWANADISTYKSLVLTIILRFLEIKNNNDAKSIRSALILLECVLDGTERNFKDIVIVLLQMSSKYIAQGGLECELIAVSLLNIVTKALKLSHENGIKLDIFDDNSTHLKYVDYLVTSIATMEGPLILASYFGLLSESVTYFQSAMFRMILPLSASIVQCVDRLFEKEVEQGGFYQSIALLLTGLEELLEVSHSYLATKEKEGYSASSGSKGDFLQSVVSNVFSSDTSANDVEIQGERDVILQSFKQVINCCCDIWFWAHGLAVINKEDASDQMNHHSFKFKFIAKKTLEKLFSLEPLQVMETLLLIPNEQVLTLIHVLDGNRPALTLPYLFLGVVHRKNKNSYVRFSISATAGITSANKGLRLESSPHSQLDTENLMRFVIRYTDSLENAAIEDFYNDFLQFIREISTNYVLYEAISKSVLFFMAVVANKLRKSKFGEDKKVRRELSDILVKFLPNALTESPFDYANPRQSFDDLSFLVSHLQHVVNEEIGGDKFNNGISVIVSQCVAPYFKAKSIAVPEYVLNLMVEIANVGGRVKNWKTLINDFYFDNRKLPLLSTNKLWDQIIYQWSRYADNKTKVLNEILATIDSKMAGIAPALMPFNTRSDSEIESKCQNLVRIAHLLMISPSDTHLISFQTLVSSTCQYLLSSDSSLKEKAWVLLRVLLLRFNSQHFLEYWSLITYCLQTNLQEFSEALQIQAEIHSGAVFQACKTLDLLLALNCEGFSSTNEWLFIIDTINCIYKTYPYVALIDKVYESRGFESSGLDNVELIDRSELAIPILKGVHAIHSYTQLRFFLQNLSYTHYEYIYGLQPLDLPSCEDDLSIDIFT
ncbi:hypothetical protein HG537_0H01420 [Torulaspora globosa]|uniref:Uncharacterized protein n=1 Tax=Torulaspora globosa TaxID=48254 RepID=A0A7H9HY89_9SACH|nr:hypothetical protein HG537_0H01420 [Torulaspora sp. CBS 2947]